MEPRSGSPINAAIEVLGALWSMLVLRDVVFGNRRHFRELLESVGSACSPTGRPESGSAVTTMTVVQHSAEALPPTGVLCAFLAVRGRRSAVSGSHRRTAAAHAPACGVNGCGGRKARW